jgi:hypothetical protein
LTLCFALYAFGLWVAPSQDEYLAQVDVTRFYVLYPLTLYVAVVYLLGCFRFARFETVGRSGAPLDVLLLIERPLAAARKRLGGGTAGPWTQLLLKELHLQQVNLILAGLFTLGFLGLAGLKVARPMTSGFFLDGLLALWWFSLPLVAGALATAEERNLGLLESQLTLPPSHARQWAVKSAVMFAVAGGLGVALPFLLRSLAMGRWGVITDASIDPRTAACALLSVTLGMYLSSFASSPLRAIVGALALAAAAITTIAFAILSLTFLDHHGGLEAAFEAFGVSPEQLVAAARADPINTRAWSVGICLGAIAAVNAMAYRNYRSARFEAPLGWYQIGAVVLIAAAAMTCTMLAWS